MQVTLPTPCRPRHTRSLGPHSCLQGAVRRPSSQGCHHYQQQWPPPLWVQAIRQQLARHPAPHRSGLRTGSVDSLNACTSPAASRHQLHLPAGFPGGSVLTRSPAKAGDLGSVPGLGRSPGEGNGNPLQYSCLENPMDRGAWRATDHRVAQSKTQLRDSAHTRTSLLPRPATEAELGTRTLTSFWQHQCGDRVSLLKQKIYLFIFSLWDTDFNFGSK